MRMRLCFVCLCIYTHTRSLTRTHALTVIAHIYIHASVYALPSTSVFRNQSPNTCFGCFYTFPGLFTSHHKHEDGQ